MRNLTAVPARELPLHDHDVLISVALGIGYTDRAIDGLPSTAKHLAFLKAMIDHHSSRMVEIALALATPPV